MTNSDTPQFENMINNIIKLLKNRYFYIGLLLLFSGMQSNFISQSYLQASLLEGESMPALNDLILDNLPYWDIDVVGDIFSLFSIIIFILYIVHKNQYDKVPYFLILIGIFQLLRAIFIILTPIGNHALFDGTEGPFGGFSKIELGVYPSGHIGAAYLYFILTKDKLYKRILLFSAMIIMVSMVFSRSHYSIDLLSGMIFVYAIKSFGDKYFRYYLVKDGEN